MKVLPLQLKTVTRTQPANAALKDGRVEPERLVFDFEEIDPLIPDPTAAGLAALRQRGHYPINHLIVVRDELIAAHPDLPAEVFAAFERAKDLYVEGGELLPLHRQVTEITGTDPLPYGVEPNLAAISQLIDQAVAQGILTRRPEIDNIFVPV